MRDTYHHGNLRADLLRLGESEIAATGIDHFGLREVARKAGVSIGAVFRHFKNKDDLVRGIAVEGFRGLLAALNRTDPGAQQASLRQGFRAYLQFASERPGCLKCMFGGILERSLPDSEVVTWSTQAFQWLVVTIEGSQSAGCFTQNSSQQLALSAFVALHGASSLLLELGTFPVYGRLSPTELADLIFDSHWTGFEPH